MTEVALKWQAQQEEARHNVEQEEISREQNRANWAKINLGWAELGETARHNQAWEFETNRANTVAEEQNAFMNKVKARDITFRNLYEGGRTVIDLVKGVQDVAPGIRKKFTSIRLDRALKNYGN